MKLKNFLIVAAVIGGFAAGINALNEDTGSSGLEKDLSSSLPAELTTCYCIDNSGGYLLNSLEVKDLTIDRQVTNGNYKSVDCTIELEGSELDMTVCVNLECIKYDDGQWSVEAYSELAEPKVVPKFSPLESSFIWNLQRYGGYQSLLKTDTYIDLEKGEATYMYTVQDVYPYMRITGGVSCSAVFRSTGTRYCDQDVYHWSMSNGVPANIEWDVFGTWHMEADDGTGMPQLSDITITGFGEGNAGTSTYAYQTVKWENSGFLTTSQYSGEYKVLEGGASCVIRGETPSDAQCVINGYNSTIVITSEGVAGEIGGYPCNCVVKK